MSAADAEKHSRVREHDRPKGVNLMTKDEKMDLADRLDAKAFKTLQEVVGSVLGAKTYHRHAEFAERLLRVSDALRTRVSKEDK